MTPTVNQCKGSIDAKIAQIEQVGTINGAVDGHFLRHRANQSGNIVDHIHQCELARFSDVLTRYALNGLGAS